MSRTMKKNKSLFVGMLLGAITLIAFGSTFFIFQNKQQQKEQDVLKVVTSFYPMYVATANVTDGIEHVQLENLSEPETGCLHDYQLRPEDMKLLSTADVLVINGGGIEEFLAEVASAYPDLVIVNASEGIVDHGDNPHVWMSISSYQKQVLNIAEGLAAVDKKNQDAYTANAGAYIAKLDEMKAMQEDLAMASQGQPVVLFHEALEYFAEDMGMEVVYTMDLDEERQVSAGEVAEVMGAVKKNDVSAILADETYGKELGDMVADSTDARAIYLDPMVRGEYDKDSYIAHMQANLMAIRANFVAR